MTQEIADRQRSKEAGFEAHVLEPVDEIALRTLLADLGARKQEINMTRNTGNSA
jgi:hypothetical protein